VRGADQDRGRCAGLAGRVAGVRLAGVGQTGPAAAAPVCQLTGAAEAVVEVAGIVGRPVAGRASPAGGRWGPGRMRCL